MQTRGLVVLDSPVGLVAYIPTGMVQVSSVVLATEVGRQLHKGQELGYFAFGGSDFVMVFEPRGNVHLDWQQGVREVNPGRHQQKSRRHQHDDAGDHERDDRHELARISIASRIRSDVGLLLRSRSFGVADSRRARGR